MNLERLEERALLAVRIWDGGGAAANTNWSAAVNWVGDVAPIAGDDLVFAAGVSQTNAVNDLAAGTRFNTIEINGTGYNITGNAIGLAGGLTANNVTGANTFALNVALQNAQTLMNANPGATLNLTGAIDTGNLVGNYFFGTAPAIIFDGAGTTNSTGVISGAGSISKLGGGTVVLGGVNTYEGITEARQGFLRVTNNSGLGLATTGHTEVQAGAALELSGVTTAESFVIREGGVGFGNGTDISSAGALRGVGGVASTITGNVELVGGNNLIGTATGSTLTISGQVLEPLSAGNRRLIKVGPGTLRLTGSQPNVFTGDTHVLQGALELGKTGAGADKAIGANLIIGDNIGGDNAAIVRLIADNQLPQLNLFDVALNTVTLNSSGVLELGAFSDTIGNLTLTTGSTYSADVSSTTGTLILGGNLTVNGFQGSSGATPAASISGKLDLGTFFSGAGGGTSRVFAINDTQHANVATDLVISAVISGTSDVSITRSGAGTLRLTGANTFAGPFIMNGGGIVEIGGSSVVGAGPLGIGLVSLQNNNNILRPVGASRSISNAISLDGDVYFLGDDATAGTENLTFTGNITLTAGRTLFTEDPTQTITFAGVIGEGVFGSAVLNKSGRGTVVFEAANTYSGTTTLNNDGGTLILRGAGSVLNVSSLTVGIGATLQIDNNSGGNVADRINDATTVNVNGRLLYIGNSAANSSEVVGTINPGTDVSSTIEVQNTSAGGTAFSSVLVGSALAIGNNRPTRFLGTGAPLSSNGSNRLAFTNNPANLVNGIIQQGVIEGPGGAIDFATYESSPEGFGVVPLPATAYVTDINLAGPASNVRLSSSVALTTSKNISALLLGPNVNLSGVGATVTVSGGSVIQTNGSNISATNISFGGGGLVYVPSGATATIDGSIYNAGALRKDGAGKLILTGDNQYTGQTQVNEGVLNIRRSTALGSTAGDTTVRPTGSLEIEKTTFGDISIGLENFTINGTGGLANVGGLRNLAGNATLAGNLTIDGNTAATNDIPLKYGGWMGVNSVNNAFGYVDVATGTTFTVTGTWVGNQDLVKIGGGTLEFSGINTNPARSSRIYEGTLLLTRVPGLSSNNLQTTSSGGGFGTVIVGSDVVGAPAATVKLGLPDQLRDDNNVNILSTGLLDLNGQSDRVAGVILAVGPAGAGDLNIGTGATLTLNGDINVFTLGSGNSEGSTITGGALALQQFGTIAGAGSRNIQANDGATGTDLTITSAIIDGTGLQSVGINKNGFGTVEFGGTIANTFTGDTVVNEGTLIFNKGTGTGGVNAVNGRIFIGDNNPQSGFAGSDILRLAQSNQIPDWLAPIDLRTTGRFELGGKDETIGQADAQNALTLRASSVVDLGGGKLTINGNINTNAAEGATLWTPVVGTRIVNGTLDLGALPRSLDVPDRAELPYELDITANIVGTGGILFSANNGTLLLSGNNTGLSGDIVRTNGNFAVGSDTAFGSARVLMNAGMLSTYFGPRTLANEFLFAANVIGFLGGNNLAGTGILGGGGNDLKITGLVNVTAGTWQPSVPFAGQVEFAGGIGETFGSVTARKIGYGTMIVSSVSTLNGLEVGQDGGGGPGFTRLNGGTLVLRDGGTWLNASPLIGIGGVLQIDNSGLVNNNRLADGLNIDLAGGTLALVGKSGAAVGEVLGPIRLRNTAASSTVQAILPTAAGSTATWRFATLSQETINIGNTLRFVGRGVDLTSSGANKIALTALPTMTNGIIPFSVLEGAGGLDFTTLINPTPTSGQPDNYVTALTTFATTFAGATATTNVKLAAGEAIDAVLNVNAVLIPAGGRNLTGTGALTVGSGLLVSSGNNTVSVPTLTLGGAEGIVFADNGTLTVSSSIAGATTDLGTAGRGTIVLAGANTHAGTTRVTSGTTRATNDTAFGTTAAGVTVTYGSTVELANNINVPAETIDVSGTGDANFASVGLRNIGGNNTWNGNLTLQISGINRNAIEVASGSSLVLGGVVSGQGLSKTGAGVLELAGTAANTFGGGGLLIWQGTVNLNKTGANAVATNTTVGDNVGLANADQLVLLQDNQIADGNNVTVSSVGRFNIAAASDVINVFSVQAGLVASGTISGTTGVLTINGNSTIDTIANSGGGGAAGPTTISANLAMGGTGPRVVTVNDSAAVNDLNFTGALSGVDFQKAGAGRATFSGDSSAYAGVITVNGGELVVKSVGALGSATGNTVVNSGFTLIIDGVTGVAEPLSLNGAGFGGRGAVLNVAGNNQWTGAVTLAGGATIGVNAATTLDIAAAIGGGAFGITKLLPGTLTFSGTAANTYTGTTLVSEGVLLLNKTAGTNAVAGTLTIGNINGGQGNDLVRWLQSNQLATSQTVLVESGGLLDLNGNSETLDGFAAATNAINLRHNTTQSGQIITGAGTLTLATNANIASTLNGGSLQTYLSTPSIIAGNLNLGGVTHGIDVADVGLLHGEMLLNATITGALAANAFTKTNAGVLGLAADNSTGLAGATSTLSGGGLALLHSNALGTATSVLNVTGGTQLFSDGTPNLPANVLPLNYPMAITLNSDLTLRGDQSFTLSGLISGQGAANRTLTLNTQNAATVSMTGGISLSNDATARTFIVNNNTFNHLAATISGVIANGAGATTHALQKGGNGWLTLTNNANSYAGVTTVAAGLLQVTANGALGTNGTINTNQTTVNNGASLVVAPGVNLPEWLVLNNNGFGNFGSIRLLNAVPGTTETATISGSVNFNATAFVGVDGGGANPDRLIFTGALNSGGGLTTKVGLGEVEFAGTADNGVTFTGGPSPFDDGIEVRAGTLYFNKSGSNRILSGGAINIGDGGGGDNADRLIIIGSGTDHIGDGLTVTVGATGQVTFGGASTTETIANLILTTGQIVSGDIDAGTRILTVTANVTVNTFNVTTGAAPAAQMAGNLVVNGTFTINDTFVPSANDDLSITTNFFAPPLTAAGGFYPGLREGRIANNAFDTTTPNPGNVVYLFPRAGETNASPPWGDNTTFVYTGEVFDADGIFSFAENIDDNVLILIDGIERLRNTSFNTPTSTANATNNAAPAANITNDFGMGPAGDGWHSIEIRMGNGNGGAGAVAGTGWTTAFGLGFSATGSTGVNGSTDGYVVPLDPGNQTLFRTPVAQISAATPSGVIAGLTKAGAGTLNIAAPLGITTAVINGGTLKVSGNGSLPVLENLNANAGTTLLVDNSATNSGDRVNDVATINLTGATLSIVSNASAAAVETVGPIFLNAANAFINTIQSTTVGTGSNTLISPSLTRNGGATVDFAGVGSDIGSVNNQVRFTGGTNPFVNGVIPYATVTGPAGLDLVADGDGDSTTAPFSISRVATYASDINTVNGIVKLTANSNLTASNTIAGLLITGGANVTANAGATLTIGTATAGLIVSASGANKLTLPVAFGGNEQLVLVQSGSLEIAGGLSGTNTLRKERAGTLILSADNSSMTGAIQAQQGTLIARNNNAFGTTAGGVFAYSGATLVLDGNFTIGNESLEVNGSTGTALGTVVDSLQVINGTTTWGTGATAININTGNAFLNIATGSTMNFNGTVGGGAAVFKTGGGELAYQGTAQNGNVQPVFANQGTLRLAKTGGTGPIAVRNTLHINDLGNFDPVGTSTVIYDATAVADQIGDVTINVNIGGTLDFNGISDTVANTINVNGGTFKNTAGGGTFQINGLVITGGLVDSGTGTLNLNGNITYNSGLTGGTPATINGNLNLVAGNPRTINVNDGYFVNNDLTINAVISNGRVFKNGNGALLLTNAGNTFLPGIDEVQTITLTGAPTFGTTTFNITFDGNTTATINYQTDGPTTAANIQAALEALPNIGVGGVTVASTSALVYNITFTGHLGSADLPNQITFAYVAAGGGTGPTLASTNGIAGFRLNAGTLSIGNNSALGTSRLHIDGTSQLLPVGGAKTLANNLTINPNITVTFGGRRDFGGTDNLTLSGGLTLIGPTSGQVVNLDVNDPLLTVTMSGVISSGGNFLVPTKRGNGTMVWSGNNTFDVRDFVNAASVSGSDGIRLENGILRIAHSNGLGFAGEVATVSIRADFGAVLEIDGTAGAVNLTGRILDIAGIDNGISRGFLNRTSTADFSTGIVRNVAGANSITASQVRLRNIAANQNSMILFVGVNSGSSLNINAALVGLQNDATPTVANNKSVFLTGGGTLRLSGSGANTITGTTAAFAGTLELNKTPDAADGGLAVAGPLQIGDNVTAATVRWLASEQLAINQAISLGMAGTMDLNGFIENTSVTTTLTVGPTSSSNIITGAAGNWVHRGDVTVVLRPGSLTAVPATISGNVQLTTATAAQRVFTVNDGPADVELIVNANITDVAAFAGGLNKAGAGRMVLSPTVANTYTGAVTVSGGVLRISGDSGLGTDAGGTTVNGGTSLELTGGFTEVGETLTLNGTGIINAVTSSVFNNGAQSVIGTGALRSLAGTNVWQGNVVINNNPTSIAVDAGNVTFNGNSVLSGGGSLLKTGAGTLELGGSLANTYTGNTYVNQGTLVLNKDAANLAIPNAEIMIGDNVGADNGDVLLYAATAGTNQIGDRVVRVARTGLLNFNGVSDTINNTIVLDVGPTMSADFATGTGVFTSNNQFTVINQAGTTIASVPAIFTGTYDLNGATRNVEVREGNAPVEFDIQGVIQVTGAFGITKVGQGRLRLSGNNTYSGTTTVNFGVLEVGSDNALGTTAAGTTVANQAALYFRSTNPLNVAEALTVSGDGWNNSGDGVLRSVSPANVTLTGTITVPSSSYLNTTTFGNNVAGTTLTLQSNTLITSGNLVINGAGDMAVPASIIALFIGNPYFSTIQGRLFMATGLGVNNTNINNLVPGGATVPATTAALSGALNFPQDADTQFTTFFGGQPGGNAFTAVYVGIINIPTTGTYHFAVTNNDDTATFWIDSNSNDTYDASELLRTVGCCNDTGFVTTTLNAGTYKFAFAVEDTGGGSGLTARFQPGVLGVPASGTAMPIVSTIGLGNVTKNGTGTLTLSGPNNFNNTTVNQGTVFANNATSALGGGTATVNAGGTLGGTGNILGPVVINTTGIVTPGVNNTGVLRTGSLTEAGSYQATINNGVPNAGGTYDQLNVTGTVDLTGSTLDLTINRTTNVNGDAFVLIRNDGSDAIVGSFAGLPEGTFIQRNGILYSITYTFNADGGAVGNDVALIDAPTQDLYWDADGNTSAATGGTGTWDTTTPQWRIGSPTGTLVTWDNGNNDNAIFAGTAGTVSLQPAGVTAQSLNFQVNGYTLQNNTLTLGSGTAIVNVNGGATAIINSNIAGSNGLNKQGGGTLALQGVNSYGGTTTVSAGTLAGDGSIVSALVVNGGSTFAPGGAPGDIATGALTINSGANFNVDIFGTSPVTQYDQVVVTGTVALNNATLNANLTGTYAQGTVFVLIRNDGTDAVTGTFSGLAELAPITLNGQRFHVSYRYNAEAGTFSNGNDVVLIRNRAPVANPDTATANEDVLIAGSVIANDTDPDNDTLVNATVVTPPAQGTLILNPNGSFTYTAPTNFSGPVNFSYTISDGEFTSSSANVTLTIVAVADAPTLTVQPAQGNQDTAIPLSIVGALVDTDGSEVLTYRIAGVPTGATLSAGVNQGGGVWTLTATQVTGLTITPPLNSRLDFNLNVTAIATEVSNSSTAQTSAVLPVNVIAAAVAPNLTVQPVSGTEYQPIPLNIQATLVYNDGSEILTAIVGNVPTDAEIIGGVDQGGGNWFLTAANIPTAAIRKRDNLPGNASFNLSVTAIAEEVDPTSNPRTASVTKTMAVTVRNSNPTPALVDVSLLGTSYGPISQVGVVPGLVLTFTVTTTDPAFDSLDQPFQFVLNWGDGVGVSTGTTSQEGKPISFSYGYGNNGVFQPTLRVTDKDGGTATINLSQVTASKFSKVGDVLYVGGTTGADRIIVAPGGAGVSIRINNALLPTQSANRVVIFGNDGADTITVSGFTPPVEFYGGLGDDYLAGGSFADTLDGGEGRDRLLGGGGNDVLLGGPGADTISGAAGNDYASGDEMIDLFGGNLLPDGSISVSGQMIDSGISGGNDTVSGDAGNDTIIGGFGNDTLNGGVGNDFIRGGLGSDKLDGGDGNDFLFGEAGSDAIYGRAGRDVLIGGGASDSLLGGTSADLMYGSDLDAFFASDDLALTELWMMWSQGQSQNAADLLSAHAVNDNTPESPNGEGDTDWYLLFANDRITQATEKTGNIVIKLP